VPAVGDDVCGAAFAVCDAGAELSLLAVVVWVTEVVPADVGAAVLFVSCFTTLGPPGEPSLVAASRTARDGLDPPDPLGGTVVVTGLVVVLVVAGTVVAGAAVLPWAGAAGATVVAVGATVVLGVP